MSDKSQAIMLFEKMDEKQIERADKSLKQAMVYTTKIGGKEVKEITYVGIKHLILELSTRDHPLTIMESKCDLVKDDTNDKATWRWRAYKKFKNTNTGLETDGRSECPYLNEQGHYDPFGQRKADSKAERNAQRKQIPELVIKEFLKSVGADRVEKVQNEELCRCQPIVCKNKPAKDGICPECKKARAE